jgi:hypothetical protein
VIWLEVDDAEVLQRALGPLVDPASGTKYHLYANPPPVGPAHIGLHASLRSSFARPTGVLKRQILDFERNADPLAAWLGATNIQVCCFSYISFLCISFFFFFFLTLANPLPSPSKQRIEATSARLLEEFDAAIEHASMAEIRQAEALMNAQVPPLHK